MLLPGRQPGIFPRRTDRLIRPLSRNSCTFDRFHDILLDVWLSEADRHGVQASGALATAVFMPLTATAEGMAMAVAMTTARASATSVNAISTDASSGAYSFGPKLSLALCSTATFWEMVPGAISEIHFLSHAVVFSID